MGVAMAGAILRRVGRANAGLARRSPGGCSRSASSSSSAPSALIASFVLAGAVVARLGDAPLAAYQIAFQLWIFLALVLDSIAIAGQIIVGRELGAARPAEAYAASVRMIWLSVVTGAVFALVLLALRDRDPPRVHLRRGGARAVRAAVADLRADAAAQRRSSSRWTGS